MTRRQALVDIVLALLLMALGVMAATAIAYLLRSRLELPQLLTLALQGLLVLASIQLLLRRRQQRWRELGLVAPTAHDLGRGVVALLCVFGLNAALSLLLGWLSPAGLEDHQQRLIDVASLLTGDLPIAAVAASMLFVGFYEELLARGFLLDRCRILLGGDWGPVLLSSLLFGLGHAYQGWMGILQTAMVGVVLAAFTLRWGTLWPAIFAHALLNTVSLALLREFGESV